jgi:hypothetical protein
MKFLEAATVNPDDRNARFTAGYNASARECGVQITIEDACDAAETIAVTGDADTGPGSYKVVPFSVVAMLRRSTMCAEPDDHAWLVGALERKLDFVLARAMTIQPIAGHESWLGGPGVQEVALAGSPPTAAQRAASIIAAHTKWHETIVADGPPVMHVPDALVPELIGSNIIKNGAGGTISAWEEPVVTSAGYDAHPIVFFTAPYIVRMTGINAEGRPIYNTKLNNETIPADVLAVIDVPPCSIVRSGAYA